MKTQTDLIWERLSSGKTLTQQCPHCSAPVRSMGNMWQEAGVVYAQAWCKQCEKIVKVEIERAEN